ncbi:hypothetical protein [Salaquimonas pukyongi]|uniref:hypothetical protein n=1 Tax=Salaquimonas pukyongi TaxID=2712698 RepID=UPI00096B99B4|nr:hypothetical protein [Salaquimonas pukyongi]
MVQRLNIKSARYDRLSECVLMDGRNLTVAVTKDGLEALYDVALEPDEAVIKAIEETRRLTRLAEIVPADDGRVLITRKHIMSDGRYLDDAPIDDDTLPV